MSPITRKLLLAGAMALAGALGDIGAQLATGAYNSAPRTVLVGLAFGVIARVVGAVLSSVMLPSEDPPQ